MKGTSKVIMGATLVMVVTLAMVLGLVLVLLAQLYCSLLLRRRRQRRLPSTATTATAAVNDSLSQPNPSTTITTTSPLSSFYSHGVLNAPINIFFPKQEDQESDIEKQNQNQNHHSNLLHFLESQQIHVSKTIISPPPPPLPTTAVTINPIQRVEPSTSNISSSDGKIEDFVYISNPIFDNEIRVVNKDETPFETPDTSPSRLDPGDSGDDSDDDEIVKCCVTNTITPPLSPMKELPKEGCSVSLRDARSLSTSSDSNSVDNNGASSSSSGSPCTSPSW